VKLSFYKSQSSSVLLHAMFVLQTRTAIVTLFSVDININKLFALQQRVVSKCRNLDDCVFHHSLNFFFFFEMK
jgi:hypothetical protein